MISRGDGSHSRVPKISVDIERPTGVRCILLLLTVIGLLVCCGGDAWAAAPPEIHGESTSALTKDSVTFQAQVNPRGLETTYHVEYDQTASYGDDTPESSPPLSGNSVFNAVSEAVGALLPNTEYHFRFVASNADGTVYGPDRMVRTSPGRLGLAFTSFSSDATNSDDSLDLDAGSHPYELTTVFSLDIAHQKNGRPITDGGTLKDVEVGLPAGFVGDPNAVPTCSLQDFSKIEISVNECPDDTAVGVVYLYVAGELWQGAPQGLPIYNLAPPPGVAAEFGFPVLTTSVVLGASARTGGESNLRVFSDGISQALQVTGASFVFWGVPADPAHDTMRGHCLKPSEAPPTCPAGITQKALLTMPTSCSAPLVTSIRGDSWVTPESYAEDSYTLHNESGAPLMLTGCEDLNFEPSLSVAPDTRSADTPAGVTVDVKANQEGLLSTTGVAPSDIQDTQVTLPEGLVVNPGQAAGLVACQPGEDGLGTEAPPSCPAASKVGSVSIKTPLLTEELTGPVYILPSNPPNLQLLVAPSGSGVNLKLIGDVSLNPVTGQLTSSFENTPALPFTDLKLAFSGGAQAALATPATCGLYSTAYDFTPWASPFVPDVQGVTSFRISSGTGGSPCASPLPFSPSMIAGATTDQAGGYTEFSLLLKREDDQQRMGGLRFQTPPGLLGMIRGVPLCGASEAEAGICSAASQIGHVVVGSGPGPFPLYVPEPGQPPAPIYLTGPYEGAPFGLSIVVPVKAGPFDLGTIVTRARIEVDPHTSQITVVTDQLPQIVKGVPVDLRVIDTVIDRPSFMFNPTSCSPLAFSGTASSVQGATAPISSRFQVGSCSSLAFKPDFKVSTSAYTSRHNGASLDVKLTYPTKPLGGNQATSQSAIAKAKVDLPRQLPSRLTTLQKACPDHVFNADPAQCPVGSRVGNVTATTPVLAGVLSGPAYFVSHGGAAFPDLIFVLQGQGVRIDVVATTYISKKGITSSTLNSVPDVPIYTFELRLPQGPNSALAANGNLCKAKLRMPTAFLAHDGAEIHQSTPITVNGCKRRTLTRHKRS